MANRYANLEGSKKISEDFGNINIGFDRVQAEMDTKGTPADAQAKADAAKTAAIAAAAADLAAHKARGADEHPTAKGNAAGFMSAADKLKSDASTSAATPDTLMQRDAAGRAKVAAPAATDDIARKAETDAVQSNLDSHTGDTVKHVTQAEHDKLNGIAAGAEVNQNAFSKINDVAAGSKTDTVTLVGGTGITITTDPANKRVSFTATGEATPGPHALSHIQGGTDVIPDAETGGVSGLMSGADAQYLRVGVPERFDEIEEYVADQIAAIPPVNDATLTDKGIVQLSKSTTGDRDTIAATESAVGAVQHQVGNLAELQTTDKDNLVDALNEVFTHVDEGKEIVKTAVIVKGGTVAGTSPHSFAELVDGIGTIETATVINGQIKRKVVYAENINGNDPIYAVPQIGDIVEISDKPSGSYSRGVAYSRDGSYMACVLGVSPFVVIYKITDGMYTRLPDPAILPTGDAYSVDFSPEGDLVVAHANAPYITIYKRSSDTFTKLPNPSVLPAGAGNVVAFSPNGVYMVVGHQGIPLLTAYKRSGDTFKSITLTGHPSAVYGISFSPDGFYLALAHTTTPFVTIFKRNDDTFTKLPNPAALPTGNGKSVSFSPDGGILAVALEVSPFIALYSRSGDVFTKMVNPDALPYGYATKVVFNTEGDMFAVSHYGTPFIAVYRREGISFIKMNNPTTLPGGAGLGVAFSPDGINLSVVGSGIPNHTTYEMSLQAFMSNNSLSNVKSGQSLGYALETGITGDKKDAIIIWR